VVLSLKLAGSGKVENGYLSLIQDVQGAIALKLEYSAKSKVY